MRDEKLIAALASCSSPETMLAAILGRHPDWQAPIAIETFAASVGVAELRAVETDGTASGLLTDLEKSKAIILYSAALSKARRRFAIAHGIGHFLLKTHRGDRQCSSRDLGESRRDTDHRKQEMQANRFAAGLLMPKPWFTALVESFGKPSVAHLPRLASAYGVTLEAAVSRYADLAQDMCAFLFIKDGAVRLIRASRAFPPISVSPGDPAPARVLAATPTERIVWQPTDVRDWLAMARDARPPKLAMQILSSANGVQLVMLAINAAAERRADEEEEKAAVTGPKFGRPRSR